MMGGVRALVVAGLSLITLAACGKEPAPDPPPSPDHPIVESVPSVRDYCEVQGLRQMIADGEVDRSVLPEWADLTEVDGTPLIVDFKKQLRPSSAEVLDKLFYFTPELKEVDVDRDYIDECIDSTTDADIERTQGGPGYLAKKETAP